MTSAQADSLHMAGDAARILAMLDVALDLSIPGARLRVQALPLAPSLRVALLCDAGLNRPLDDATVLRVMESPLYWVFCWASGQVLAAQLLANPAFVRGLDVLDFGAGSGVVAIAAARAGARRVIACDSDPLAREAIACNCVLNGVSVELCAALEERGATLDMILAADVLYDRTNLPWLQRFRECAAGVLVADSRLRDFREPGFERIGGAQCSTLPDLDEAGEFRHVSLYAAGTALSMARQQSDREGV